MKHLETDPILDYSNKEPKISSISLASSLKLSTDSSNHHRESLNDFFDLDQTIGHSICLANQTLDYLVRDSELTDLNESKVNYVDPSNNMRDFLLSRPSSMLSRTTFENMMKFRTLMYNNDNNYMNDDSGDETSDNNSDDFIECDEDLQRVKQLDELIGSLQNVSFETIIPNSYVQMVTTVPNVRVLKSNDHIVSLQTFIRNKLVVLKKFRNFFFKIQIFFFLRNTPRDEFIFNADRLVTTMVLYLIIIFD